MADNNFRTYRSLDPIAYGDADPMTRDVANDPLAELARLIGQSEPAAEYGRSARQSPPDFLNDAPAAPEQDWAADADYAEPQRDAGHNAGYVEPPRYEEDRFVQPRLPDFYEASPSSRAYSAEERYVEPELPPAVPYSERTANFDGGRAAARAPVMEHDKGYRDEPPPASYLGGELPALAPESSDDGYDAETEWREDGGVPSFITEAYEDDAPSRPRRSGFVIVLAVLGLAVLGTAGAFAYRSMFGGVILPSLPPIIKASDGPNKIIPTQAGTPSQASAANPGPGEKLVSREEQPVAIQPPPVPPRVVSTIPVLPAPGTAPAAGAPPNVSAPSPFDALPPAPPPAAAVPSTPPAPAIAAGSAQPKKIHTVSIRADQPAGAAGPGAAAPAAAPVADAPAARTKTPPPPAARPSAAPAPQAGANAPLAIVPIAQGSAVPAAPVATPSRTRVVHTEAPNAPLATTTAPASSAGGYSVQVTSQRSEADAQTAYQSLRAKFPKELGGHEPIIRRADLGDKGTYYRALVGPFASAEAAAGLCSNLKAAGGACLVQRN